MKKTSTLFSIIAAVIIMGLGNQANAQLETERVSMGEIDPYFSAYLKPFGQAMATSLGGGWTHTAKVHGTLGFDFTFSFSAVQVPSSDFTIKSSSLNMPNYTFNGELPTISGDEASANATIARNFENEEFSGFDVDALDGANISYGGMFAMQGAIGLPKGTELILRFMPDLSGTVNSAIDGEDVQLEKTNMWGVGVKHDIKQWIPAISKVPFLQISALLTYSKFQTGFSGEIFRFDPELYDIPTSLPSTTWDDQKFTATMSAFTGNLLVGANIPVFQPYIGVGFNSSSFEAGFKGNYPVVEFNPIDVNGTISESEKDPLTSKSNATKLNFQAGARLKLGFFVFHYTFTAQEYKMHTGGVAFTFR